MERYSQNRLVVCRSSAKLLDCEELDVKVKRCSAGDNSSRAAIAVAEIGRNNELAATSNLHVEKRLIPCVESSTVHCEMSVTRVEEPPCGDPSGCGAYQPLIT